MADSFIQLSPDSTGKRVDTRTAPDGDHREVQVIGSPTTAEVAEADAANGLDVDVTRLPSIPAGTNNIGDVDIASLPNEGQQNMAGSISVAIASDQSAIPVSLASSPLPAGGSTLAEQQTQTGHLSQIEIAVEILDNAISGSEMQVDVVAPLPAGTNNIGDVDVLSSALPTGAATSALQTQPGVDIGDVTVNNAAGAAAVNVQDGGNSLTVDGSVTANAGTNLNTSALALEAGGNLAAIAASASVLDDWDETNRAAVNTIAGQIGVQGASGTVNALTQRVVLATDVGLPAGSANIGDVDVLTLPAIPAGNNNIGDVDIASIAAGQVLEVVGDVAADAAVPTNPVIIGGRASTAQPTPVSADGDSVNIWTNRKGSPIVAAAPHVGLFGDPWALTGETAQYTTTQTSTVLVAGGASERLVVTKVQIQVGGTTAGTVQLYFGTGAYSRGTNLAIFDGEFAPSATLKPGVVMDGPFISATNGDDLLVTTSAAINPITITVWFYVIT